MQLSLYHAVGIGLIGLILIILAVIACIRKYSNDAVFVHQTPFSREINGEYAIVTGANRGIGRAITTLLVERGCNVILGCRSKEKALNAIHSIQQKLQLINDSLVLGEMRFIELDLSSFDSIDTFIETVQGDDINVSSLILNAAINPPTHLKGVPEVLSASFISSPDQTHKQYG
eukprot:853351_1